jgi:glucan biosynthesis protein
MPSINIVQGTKVPNPVPDLGSGSLQLVFAQLQMSLCSQAKNSAMSFMDQIKDAQAEQKQVADFLQQARQLQADAGDKGKKSMPKEMAEYMDKYGLAKGGEDKAGWEVTITSLQARLDALGNDTQQKMVYVQDYMGQYNSYLQGANSSIQQGSQTLGQLAKVQ